MNLRNLAASVLCSCAVLALQAGDLPVEAQAKFLKVIATSGGGRIACGDPALKGALEAQGVTVDRTAMIVWASNPMEAKMAKQAGRLVVAGHRDLLAWAGIILEDEGGRPKLVFNTTNIKASRVQLSDAVMKIGSRM
jgi:hypothetical protein